MSSTLENGSDKTMPPVAVTVECEWGICAGVGIVTSDTASTTMKAPRSGSDSVIISITLEKGGEEMAVPIEIVVEQE